MSGSVRKCLIRKWLDFAGYGFNLHAEKGKAGHYIGKVDENSPAEAGGLREGDRIVEVNSVNIGSENHQEVVARIKSGGDQVSFTVVDKEGDEYYKLKKVVISGDLPEVTRVECPVSRPPPASAGSPKENEVPSKKDSSVEAPLSSDYETVPSMNSDRPESNGGGYANSESDHSADEEDLPPPPPPLYNDEAEADREVLPVPSDEPVPAAEPVKAEETENTSHQEQQDTQKVVEAVGNSSSSAEPSPPSHRSNPSTERKPSPLPERSNPSTERKASPLPERSNPPAASTANEKIREPLKCSAKEMREMLKQKKKPDPRKEGLSTKSKVDMFQRL